MLCPEVLVRGMLLLTLAGLAVVPPVAGAADLDGRAVEKLPAGLRAALRSVADAVENGDRAGLAEQLEASSLASAAPLLEGLVPGAASPRSEVRLLVAGAAELAEGGWAGRLVLLSRVAPAAVESAGPTSGLVPERGLEAVGLRFRTGPEGGLVLERGPPASVTAARVELHLDRVPEGDRGRLRVRSELDLAAEAPEPDALLLQLPAGTESVRSLSEPPPGSRWRWLAPGEGSPPGGQLLLEAGAMPLEAVVRVELEHEAAISERVRAGEGTLYFTHGAAIGPWEGERFHLWEVVLDLPAEWNGVSIGRAESLPAPEGRRRVRYRTERPIDYPGIGLGRFRVDREGPLELWRTAEVGGDPAGLLGELRELVAFHEERVAPLPYGAFRLVEVPMEGAAAVSYASVIFMETATMAQAKRRFAILSHEVAHQWWGNAVQGDQHSRWISEGMANALMDLFVAHRESPEACQDLLDEHREVTLAKLGVGARPLASVRGRAADYYHRGALFVHALREAVGDGPFWRILQAWYEEHAGPEVGTAALRATAERVAGRSLAEVFEPWLETTALPVLRLEWEPDETGASLRILQDEPHFRLDVPVEALLAGGRSSETRIPVAGPLTESRWELGERPLALRLDPRGLTPRVKHDELPRYLLAEAEACLSRGERERGLALVERYESEGHGPVPIGTQLLRSTVGGEPGEPSSAGVEWSSLSTREAAIGRLAQAEAWLERGAPEAALPVLEGLERQWPDSLAVPLALGRALHLLGRPAEAEAAWRRAHENRPEAPEPRLLLGLPASASVEEESETWLDREDPRLDGNHPETTRLLAASRDRWGLALSGSRRLWTGRGEELGAVEDFRPVGLVDAVVVDAESERPLVVTLEAGPRRSRIAVVELDELGKGRVLARHERAPARAQALTTDGASLFVAFEARDGSRAWHRFLPDLRGDGSEGPDDLDGLRTLKVRGDDRFEPVAVTPADRPAVVLRDGRFAWWTSLGALESEAGVLWEELEQAGSWQLADLRAHGEGAALLLAGDASHTPFARDERRRARLVLVGPERLDVRELPDDALQAVEAPDGGLLVLHGFAGCGGDELRVERWPAPEPGP